MFKRGQAAMEFLMTYGWAILVVLAAIGALAYFGVLSPGNLLPQKCEFSQGLDCTEQPSASGTTIQFPITNSLGYRIAFSGASSTGTGGCTGATYNPATAGTSGLPNGDNVIVTLTGCSGLVTGERFKDEVILSFTSNATGMPHKGTGSLTGKVQ